MQRHALYARYMRIALQDTDKITEAARIAADMLDVEHDIQVTPKTVRNRYAEWRSGKAPDVKAPSHVYGVQEPPRLSIPRFTGHLRLRTDQAVIIGDVHVPTTNWEFAAKVADVARENISEKKNRVLLIVGDLFNFDAMSKYDHLVPPIPLATELRYAKALLWQWLDVFDRIYMCMGNHEERIIKHTAAQIAFDELKHLLSHDERFVLSPYRHMELTSDGIHWRLTHQRNYSRRKLKVANDLSQKFETNVIAHHQHHCAIGMSDNGRYTIVDNGGLHDSDSMFYVRGADSTMPEMTNSFVFMDHGTAHLLTPYETMTDWSRWTRRKLLQFETNTDEQDEDETEAA